MTIKAFVIAAALLVAGCTSHGRARVWGGTETVTLAAGLKLVSMAWKDLDLWILTRAWKSGDVPERYAFMEKSNQGLFEGTILVVEVAPK